jgi:putative pyruvate formate lyase activating enzyme
MASTAPSPLFGSGPPPWIKPWRDRRPGRKNRPRRAQLAAERLDAIRVSLACCQLCLHQCRANRLKGPAGLCHAGASARIFSAQLEVGDELELIPAFAVALSGCNLRCGFCIAGEQNSQAQAGTELDAAGLARQACLALDQGAKSVLLLGGEPTIHLPSVMAIVAALPDDARLVLKTNGFCSAMARAWLEDLFDVWVVDYKFGGDACARRLAKVPDYTAAVRANLLWAQHHSELIVRHLLLPGHLDCCWRPVASWLAQNLPGIKVSLRTGYWPAWQAQRFPELKQAVTLQEQETARAIADEFHLRLMP